MALAAAVAVERARCRVLQSLRLRADRVHLADVRAILGEFHGGLREALQELEEHRLIKLEGPDDLARMSELDRRSMVEFGGRKVLYVLGRA